MFKVDGKLSKIEVILKNLAVEAVLFWSYINGGQQKRLVLFFLNSLLDLSPPSSAQEAQGYCFNGTCPTPGKQCQVNILKH